ncbi:polysaccharide deacetylase family protein [Aestuariirhabdus litorea]|uniref:Polysaccharide deacetylase family protein n=1 Tax=Aestuariirhabdus litorea TaxID=2528527 RepID=A0A3P3VPB1_9GAMM|nr:polysaccharide deacetylase family protein [Aestuariirhabdus litorea]RRJ84601.1 polysaccharide deacetylase family protein [Aestuariirhabdus litorea]RWW97827.1 polysaccharide deacetylase family protein [Endozoicomonadaceae bacterium GTF-13]
MITRLQNQLLAGLPQTALMYHSTHKGGENWRWSLALADFERQLNAVKAAGLNAGSITDALGRRSGANLLLTFDDGYANTLEALELILARGFSATLFVVTNHIGGQSNWPGSDRSLPLLSLTDIKRLAGLGIEIAVHGATHEDMTQLPQQQLSRQLTEAKGFLEELTGQRVTGLAYPYGRYNPGVIETVKSCGFEYACCTEAGRLSASESEYQLKRITIENGDSLTSFQRKLILGGNNADKGALLSYMVKSMIARKPANLKSHRNPL